MKIGVVVPDRNDRPQFLSNCKRLIQSQTMQPTQVYIVNHEPTLKQTDLTKRVRIGFEYFQDLNYDCVLIMENDDFYHPDYIKTMVENWIIQGKPEIFGIGNTIYYHIIKKQYRELVHKERASLMSTLINCKADFHFCKDDEVFLDQYLWKTLTGKTFIPSEPLSIGIKHGVGLCGGKGHSTMRFDKNDNDSEYLKKNVDALSFVLYGHISEEMSKARNN